ncbi:RagB/SusD family protein [Lacibacter luteus]|uniref:RagB/SusD family protein n=1 Tax=Lacibacter luteus TaxID=2508719 RepID=A0A4Q1CMF5_9BACT|nr:RagB/SusD family nutrient uptake outer membrane protein [Lacibacter luteus]RXK61799.1 RagB/SusD family protein [Lacibacter luteus]
MKKINLPEFVLVLMMLVSLSACKKVFDIQPEDQLDEANAYQNVYDADAAVIGIYGKFMGLAEQYVVLNELRADLLDVTANSNEALRQINTHTVTENNPYASPKAFYELILNCNDVLEHFKVMVQEKKMNEDQFNQRFSDIKSLRSFLYLQLGIHFGEVPYVTSSLKNVDEVKNTANFKRLPFNVLLDSLISTTESIPFKGIYPTGTNLNISVDAYQTQKFYIHKRALLGDLYLWKGNYQKAATYYREVMEENTGSADDRIRFGMYKMGSMKDDLAGQNIRYGSAGDATSLNYTVGWRQIFEAPIGSDNVNYEWLWVMPFDNKFNPQNPMIKLFSPVGGNYLLRPSQQVFDLWDGETQRPAQGGSIPYDARKLLSTMTIGGQPVAMKYLYNYIGWNTGTALNPLQKNGKWFLFRQTHLHLRFIEAANRSGKYRLSCGLLNNGIAGTYPAPGNDVTNYHNTLNEPYPFNIDARNSGNSGVPYYRADWCRNLGIRARANLVNISVPANDSLMTIESALIKEGALENAFEGTRWPDLLRIAIRNNDPSFLADRVYVKLMKSGISSSSASAARSKLMAKEWYLPFKW